MKWWKLKSSDVFILPKWPKLDLFFTLLKSWIKPNVMKNQMSLNICRGVLLGWLVTGVVAVGSEQWLSHWAKAAGPFITGRCG